MWILLSMQRRTSWIGCAQLGCSQCHHMLSKAVLNYSCPAVILPLVLLLHAVLWAEALHSHSSSSGPLCGCPHRPSSSSVSALYWKEAPGCYHSHHQLLVLSEARDNRCEEHLLMEASTYCQIFEWRNIPVTPHHEALLLFKRLQQHLIHHIPGVGCTCCWNPTLWGMWYWAQWWQVDGWIKWS